jgi:hypothetical protein
LLTNIQEADGSLGVEQGQSSPGWPTGWAVAAWHGSLVNTSDKQSQKYAQSAERAVNWLLQIKGSRIEYLDHSGHDTTIIGWPWVEGTHSWIEPTAISLLALKHAGLGDNFRAKEAVRLLQDRLLRDGGCNYGNTVVFGQELRPHLQPTGLALLALAGEADDGSRRVVKSIAYLQNELNAQTTTASLCYGLLGLAAHASLPHAAGDWLAEAAGRTLARDRSAYKLALLALTELGTKSPLIPSASQTRPSSGQNILEEATR